MIYLPLILMALFSALFALIHSASPSDWMPFWMGYFLCFFAFFKFLDIKGFASAFQSYDFITKRWPPYGFIYPFLELFLGIFFLTRFLPFFTNLALLIVMTLSSIGIVKKVFQGEKLNCACLGTTLNVPLGYVSIVESVGMALMALINLIY